MEIYNNEIEIILRKNCFHLRDFRDRRRLKNTGLGHQINFKDGESCKKWIADPYIKIVDFKRPIYAFIEWNEPRRREESFVWK